MALFKFIDKRPQMLSKHGRATDMALAWMAQDIEVIIKTGGRTPVKTGQLKSQVRHRKIGPLQYKVESNAEYSAVQELGRRSGARPFTNYTTPGTGRGWFAMAINKTLARKYDYIKKASKSVGL